MCTLWDICMYRCTNVHVQMRTHLVNRMWIYCSCYSQDRRSDIRHVVSKMKVNSPAARMRVKVQWCFHMLCKRRSILGSLIRRLFLLFGSLFIIMEEPPSHPSPNTYLARRAPPSGQHPAIALPQSPFQTIFLSGRSPRTLC